MTKFSIVVEIKSDNYPRLLKSIINQNYDLNKIELIILDYLNIEKEINKYKNNFTINYLSVKDIPLGKVFNKGLDLAEGNIITFIDSDNYYNNKNVFKKVSNINNPLISISSYYYDMESKTQTSYLMNSYKKNYVDLDMYPNSISLDFNSYFINTDLIKEYRFDENNYDDTKRFMLMNLLLDENCFYYLKINNGLITTNPFETNTSKCSIQYNKWWYTESINNYISYAEKLDEIPNYIKEILLYAIYEKTNCNTKDRNKKVLQDKDINEFFNSVSSLCEYIDDKMLIELNEKRLFKIPRWLRFYIFNNKVDSINKKYVKNNKIMIDYKYKGKDYTSQIKDNNNEIIYVQAINYKNNKLYFDCNTSLKDIIDLKQIKLKIVYNNKKIDYKRSYFYPLLKVFGKTVSEEYCFNFNIDIKDNYGDLKIYAIIGDKEVPLVFEYPNIHSRLSDSKWSYWHYKNFVLYNKQSYIRISKPNLLKLFKSELLFDLSKLKNDPRRKLLILRLLYFITKPFLRNRNIWVTFDKTYKAGDNGEYMYQYLLNNNDVEIYYVIRKEAPDYKRLIKQNKKRILTYRSLKMRIMCLHAKIILDTHANVKSYCGINVGVPYFSGIFNGDAICIQHGLTIQEIAQYQNRLFDNIKLYCIISPLEKKNLENKYYDYDDSQIVYTGIARYDGLKSNDKRNILITPTWRRNIVNSSIANMKKGHNDNFKESDYYKIYNSLINNMKLIECAKECNYRLTYLLHPAISAQIDDFDKNDFVDIIPATGDMSYEKILTESSLMVTGYSGVQFDFAYQRKPIVYYHPSQLPPHYETGVFDYDEAGFGPVCKEENEIIDKLCNYMKNNCKIEKKYVERANKFFYFSDFNNRERIYKACKEYQDQSK